MKRKFTLLNAALALLLVPLGMMAQTQATHTIGWGTASGDAGTFTNFTETSGTVTGVLSFTSAKNGSTSNPAYNANASELRLYYNSGGNGGSITITPADGITITDAVITTSTSPAVAYYVDGGSATSVTGSGNTYTISNISASSSLEIKNVNTSNTQLRIKTIAITYTSGGSTSVATTTTIDATGITNTDVYTSTAAGTLTATVTETESGDAVSGATVTWTSSKENVATIDEDGVVTLVAAGTTTITASYAGVSGEFGASSATYELTVTSSAPYVQPTEFEIGLNNALFGTSYNGTAAGIDDNSPVVGTQDNVTVTYAGSGSHYVNDAQIRFYPNNKLTFEAPEGYEIKEIVFTADGQWNATISADGGTYVSDTKTWTGSATSVLFTGSGSGHCRMSKATITLGLPSSDPIINASNVNIAYDATGGEIAYTITNPVTGTSLEATTTADWISNINVTADAVTFDATQNGTSAERVATFTLTYENAANKTVTVTQAAAPVIYTTIPALFEDATSTETDVTVTFGGWVISAVKNSNAYLTDNAGNGLIIYQSDHDFQVNDVLTGTASCKLLIYRGSAELKNLTATTEGLTVTPNGTVTVQNIAISELSGVNTGALVAYENLTYTDGKLQDSEGNQITPYTTLYNYENIFVEGHVYNVTGIYLQYNTTKEILPRSADDIEEVTSTTPTVTVAETTINVGYEGIIDTLAVTYENITEVAAEVYFCDANGNAATFDWIIAQIVAENNVEYTVEPNNGETRTAYFKVWAYDDDLNEVYSELVTVTQTAPPYSLTIGSLTHVTEIFLFNSDDESQEIDVVNNVALITEGTTVMVSVEVEQGYVIQSLNVSYGDNQSAEITELEPNVYYSFEMPAANATLTITAVEPPQPAIYTYVKANSIQSGRHYIIVNEGAFKAMGLQNSNNRAAVDIEIIDANATAEYGKAYEFVITDLNETNTDNEALYSIYDVINEGYLCAASSSSNYLKMQNTLDDNGKWTIAIAEDGKATIKAQGSYTRNWMRYNSGSSLFSCYGSGQQDIYLYERVYSIDITAHGTDANPTGWYLIASPLAGEINPTTIEGMIVTDDETTSNIDESEYFDLYRFDQSADLEWKNYKNNSFNLVSGQGYLYANANGVTLTFTGTPYEGNGKVGLVYSNDTNLDFPGWNLVGNPFGVAATINRDFYSMNENGSEIVVGSSSIAAMEGVFVIATKANDTVTFTTTASAKSSEEIPIEVTVGRGSVIDRAIVRFGEGSTMPKFQLFENSTKLYIEQNGKDYAIVSAEAQGEMPVSFRAAKNGTYTLTVNPEGVEMNYLHLIDNMTGADIDLLQTPNYTFEARTTDYTSRFRLVFGANGASAGSASDDTFAYFNGCEWMINNSGDATLQVVDVMGRVLSSEAVSGSVSKTINATPGVYMLRLVSGDTVKTQKIVVR